MFKIGLGILGALTAIALLVAASPVAHALPSQFASVGPTPAGTASATYPVQTGGVDSAGKVRKLLTDGSGRGVVGNVDRATYNYSTFETVPTAAQAIGALEADGTNKVRLRYIKICTSVGALQTTAGNRQLVLYATTAASASGSASAVPNPVDPADAAFAGVARTGALTTTPAVGSVAAAQAIWETNIFMPAAATTAGTCVEKAWGTSEGIKPPTTGIAITSGLALADLTGGTGGTGSYTISMTFTNEPN